MIYFAAVVLGRPLDPWQQWLVIHLGELLPDGRPRFRRAVVIVARQNGKTHLCTVLSLFWLFVERQPMVFGTHTDLDKARESWEESLEIAEGTPALAALMPNRHKRSVNGQQTYWTVHRCKYKIGAANRKGGRGMRIDRAIGDELREQRSWEAYHAVSKALFARPHAQLIYITNMGDARSVVLNELREAAEEFITSGAGDDRLGLFEWSAPPGTHPMDPHGWAAANPQLGRRIDHDTIRGEAAQVARPGADREALAGFLTEVMCMTVPTLKPAVDAGKWAAAGKPAPLDLSARRRLAAVIDVSPDGLHATLVAGMELPGGIVRIEAVVAWDGPDALERVRRDLPGWVLTVRPRKLGWFPYGPAAVLDADLRDRRKIGRAMWPPRGVDIAEITTETAACCMAFASLVSAGRIVHSDQQLLTAHVTTAEQLWTGDRWVFTRAAGGHVDAAYGAAGVAHLARTMPAPRIVSSGVHVGPAR